MLVDDLGRLVAFDSVSSRPVAPLADWLAQRLEDLGLHVADVPDPSQLGKRNLVATAGAPGTDGVILTGHMDVVPTEGQPWTTDPFELTERDGRLYGRGTADMKGFIAATLAALERVDPRRLRRELMLVWTYDEEVGCLGSAHLVDVMRDEGRPVPSACLVGEPTDFRILRMHSGHVAMRVEVHGEAAHSSRPDLGINAIEGAARVVDVVRRLAEEQAASPRAIPEVERPWTTLNVGTIRGGTAVNIVPDACTLDVGYRPLPGDPHLAIAEELERRIREIGGPWAIDVRVLHGIVALNTAPGTPLEAVLARWAASEEAGAASFATDGGNLAKLGTQPLVFGPGSIEVAHKADEFVEVASLHRAVDVIEAVVRARCT